VDFDAFPDVSKSTVHLIGATNVALGDEVKVKVKLYDRQGRRQKTGGDLVSIVKTRETLYISM